MINLKRALVATTTSLALVAAAQAAPVVTTSAAGAGTAASETVATTLATAVQASNSGINIVAGTATYTGAADQGGTYTGFTAGGITQADGIVLTSGNASTLSGATNTGDGSGGTATGLDTNTGSNADLSALLAANGAPNSVTRNQNVLEFSFTLADPTNNAVILDFIFGSEEFPDQPVTDGFAVFVDGVNFAEFQDGSLVTFVDGANESNFNDNSVGNPFGIELDGITDSLTLTALLDMSLSVHTIKIVIGDTQDSFFDSAVYLANMRAAFANQNDGGVTNAVPVPGAVLLFPLGIAAIGAARRRKA